SGPRKTTSTSAPSSRASSLPRATWPCNALPTSSNGRWLAARPSAPFDTTVANGQSRISPRRTSTRISAKCLGVYMEGSALSRQRCHHRLLHVQAVLGLVDGEAVRRIHHRVGGLDVAAQRQAVAEEPFVGQRHLRLVHDEVLVRITDGLLLLPAAEVRQRAPALGIDHVGAAVGFLDVMADFERAAVGFGIRA